MTKQTQKSAAQQTDSGILVVDKPAGMTSRDVVNRIQRVTGIKKCGHAGTLDPLATGVLVVCLGRATRLVPYIQDMKKRYRAEFRFGWRSNTDDIEGELEQIPAAVLPEREQLVHALQAMQGVIQQVPPQFSAIKVAGQRAYDLARQGKSLELNARPVVIEKIQLLDYENAEWQTIIECGSGTYVRSIGRDIGQQFGCGAIMTALIREAIGELSQKQAVALEDLEPDHWQRNLHPAAAAVQNLPQRICEREEIQKILHGQPLPVTDPQPVEKVALLSAVGDLIGIAENRPDLGLLKPRLVYASSSAGPEN